LESRDSFFNNNIGVDIFPSGMMWLFLSSNFFEYITFLTSNLEITYLKLQSTSKNNIYGLQTLQYFKHLSGI